MRFLRIKIGKYMGRYGMDMAVGQKGRLKS